MSLYSIIARFEQATVRPAYQLKNCREKHARYSNHLTFLARCCAHGIIPNGLRVSLPVRTARPDNIANKTSQALLRERIGHARRQKVLTSLRIRDLESDLSQSLNTERWAQLDQLCRESASRVHRTVKERQTRKFEALRNQRPIHTFTALDRKKLVVNVSHRTLSPQEEEVLALGLSFVIAPKQIPYHEIIPATEATSWRLDKPTADALRQAVNGVLQQAKTPRPNMSFQQRRTIQDLKRDETIVILPADKGRATVVMNSEDYTSKMEKILNDDKYRPLRRDPTLTIEKKVTKSLKLLHSDGHISDKLLDQLTPRYSDPPQMYGLPKVHKENIPMRPIVSTIGSPTYRLAKELARILTPLTGKNSNAVKNSAQFVTSLQNVRISPDDQLVSFDVVSLFTQVPSDHALKVVEKRLKTKP